MLDLGTLGGTNSYGRAINNVGQIAGWSQTSGDSSSHAFRYDGTPGAGGIMRDLGTLGGVSFAAGINDAGQVTGSYITGDGVYHAFRYDGTPGAGGVMRDLGTIPGGVDSLGCGINSAGQVVGFGDGRAFLYTGTPGIDGQVINLNAWLYDTDLFDAMSWYLVEADGISNDGWITGWGFYNGGTHAFLLDASSLTVPEPGALTLILVGGLPLLLARRAR